MITRRSAIAGAYVRTDCAPARRIVALALNRSELDGGGDAGGPAAAAGEASVERHVAEREHAAVVGHHVVPAAVEGGHDRPRRTRPAELQRGDRSEEVG